MSTAAPSADLYPFEHGLTWVMREWMRRASHAVVADGKVWLIDPVDVPMAIEAAHALGEFGGVIQLLDRHPRACKLLAEHYKIPFYFIGHLWIIFVMVNVMLLEKKLRRQLV